MDGVNNILLVVQCFTYNHENYIGKCLDGFVNQKTNFEFVVIVHDDASTDNTAQIVRDYADKYPNIIQPILEAENQYSKGSDIQVKIVNDVTRGYEPKYIALCEGDDFWIDPYKLQKQFDFMEQHPDYSLCHTDVLIYEDIKKKIKGRKGWMYNFSNIYLEHEHQDLFNDIMSIKYVFQPLTFFIRYESYNKIQPNTVTFMMGDMPLILDLSQKGKIKYLPVVTGIYNHHLGSATRNPYTRSQFDFSIVEMKIYYCKKYHYQISEKLIAEYRIYKENLERSGFKPRCLFPDLIQKTYDKSNQSSNNKSLWKEVLSSISSKINILGLILLNNTYYFLMCKLKKYI